MGASRRGDEIAPGRSVLKLLGGGNRYEAYLVWDERCFAVMVAKVDAARSGRGRGTRCAACGARPTRSTRWLTR